MNVLVRGLLIAALGAAMGCGGSKSADNAKDQASASTGGSSGTATTSKFDQGPRAGESKADRPAADNQNWRATGHLYLRSISWNDWMSTRRWRSAKPVSMSVVSPIFPFLLRYFSARCMPNTAACSAVLA